MRIMISKDGKLTVEKLGIMVDQWCPFDQESMCGDYCPMFAYELRTKEGTPTAAIYLCNEVVYHCPENNFTNNRVEDAGVNKGGD